MSLVIQNCKGHVHVVGTGPADGGGGGRTSGFYAIDPPIPSGEGAKCLLLGIPIHFREIVQPSVTLDDVRTLYTFGSAWNEAALHGMLLLGQSSTGGDQARLLIDWYQENRLSKKEGPVSLSIGPKAVPAYVVGLQLGAADPHFNKQAFSIIFLTSEITR